MRPRPLIAAAMMIVASLYVGPAAAGEDYPGAGAIEPALWHATADSTLIARFAERVPDLPRGIEVHYRFASTPAIYATASPRAVRALARLDDVIAVERAKPIAFDLDSATVASRARDVWSTAAGADPIRVGGEVVDGAGVGIAIVDTGVDGLHPDFQVPGKLAGNYVVSSAGVIPAVYSVNGSAHGTHVAGVAVGNGASSDGKYKGSAPGAALYGFSVSVGGTVAFPAIAFDWIIQNGKAQTPPIRVVNNSWHCKSDATCAAFNQDSIHMHLASKLAENGFTVTWSAGNSGGDGFLPLTNLESINRTPGIISVANYDDDDRGLRTRCTHPSSSRGAATQPETWPDVAAPGRLIVSTWAMGPVMPAQSTQNSRLPNGANNYRQASGTSMAAPHVAGIVALMLQANPSLTPPEIEYLLKATAAKMNCTRKGSIPDPGASDPVQREALQYVRADASHPYDGANFIDGHGLVDARAAVEAAIAFTGIPEAPEVEPLPEQYQRIRVSADTTRRLFLRDEEGLTTAEPVRENGYRVLLGDAPVTFVSEPLDAIETDAIEMELWFGTNVETPPTFLGRPGTVHNGWAGFTATVERLTDGGASSVVQKDSVLRLANPGIPIYRRWVLPLTQLHRFEAGDRLRLTLNLRSNLSPVDEPKVVWILYADGQSTPSNISFARLAAPVVPGTARECKIRWDCSEIGGVKRFSNFECNIDQTAPDHPRVAVLWTGPPGSTGVVRCHNYVASCTIPGEPGKDPWDTCEAEAPVLHIFDTYDTGCYYLTHDGARAEGYGRCEQRPMSLEPQD